MGKRFFEVFPTLKVDQDLRGLFEETEVTKVTTTSDRRFIRVHLFSQAYDSEASESWNWKERSKSSYLVRT